VTTPLHHRVPRLNDDEIHQRRTVQQPLQTTNRTRSPVRNRSVESLPVSLPGLAQQTSLGSLREPVTTPAKQRFEQAIRYGAPRDLQHGTRRMNGLRSQLHAMTAQERATIAADRDLIRRSRTFVGGLEYVSLLAAVGAYAPLRTADGTEVALHMSGTEADAFIQRGLGRIVHLRPYLQAALAEGRQAEGYLAVVDSDWAELYRQEFPSEPIGSLQERRTAAFVTTQHRDGVAILKNDRGARSEAIHESLHRYAKDTLLLSWGQAFNEGVTEYFTRLLTDRDGNPPSKGGPSRIHYQPNWEFVRDLLPLLGSTKVEQETALAEINFKGNAMLLCTNFIDRACTSKRIAMHDLHSAWARFESAIKDGCWTDARRQLP
jgi:hypothetical protein